MNPLKRLLGIVWLIIAPVVIYALVDGAITHIDPAGKKDINNPVIWVIIISIFLPIAIGLMIFGWYAFRGEYDQLPENNSDLKSV
jgi:purine-cytosine permease-like protein